MSRLEEVINQFGQALERLEEAIDARNPGAVPAPAISNEVRGQIEALKGERAELAEELKNLHAENERLANLAGEASRQLDTAIDDMRSVLRRAS